MSLVEKINEILNRKSLVSGDEIEEIIKDPVFEKKRKKIVKAINSELDYPNLNALVLTQKIPDKKYEKKLLKYQMEDTTDDQAIYWMMSLGEIKSKKGFEKIKQFTKTYLFHQAFISMAKIDIEKTMSVFEKFLDKHKESYVEENITHRHDSGFNTLTLLFEYGNPENLIKNYNLSNELKNKLVKNALKYFKENIFQ